jgi:hypothetical protein
MRNSRRSSAFRILPIILVAEFYAIFYRGMPWAGEWDWTVDWINGATILTGPLVAGCAAYDTYLWRPASAQNVARSTPRGEWQPALICWANASVGVAVHVSGLITGVVINLWVDTGATVHLQSIPVALLAIIACASIGIILGYAVRNPVAAPIAVIATFGLAYLASSGTVPTYFRVGGVTGSMVGLTWDWSVLVLLGLGLGAMSGIALSAIRLHNSPLRGVRVGTTAFAIAAAIALVASILGLGQHGDERLTSQQGPTSFSCAGDTPRVCLASQTQRQLKWLAARMDSSAQVLTAAGASVPRTFRQFVRPSDLQPADGVLFRESTTMNRSRGTAQEVAYYLTTPRDCPELYGDKPPVDSYFFAQHLLETWILLRHGDISLDDVRGNEQYEWLSRPSAEQSKWVAETYTALASCSFTDLKPPQ